MKKHTTFRSLSIRTQLTLIVSSIIAVAFGLIIYTTYTRQMRSFVQEYQHATRTILDMESSGLDQYLKDLRSFCVHPCLNGSVYQSLLKTGTLSSEEQDEIRQTIQSEYHSRTDLRSYELTVLGAGLRFERPIGGQHIFTYTAEDIHRDDAFIRCGDTNKFEYIAPPADGDTFFQYYHYMIRLRNREPVSLTRVDPDMTQLELLLSDHRQSGEMLCLFNRYGELLYTPQSDVLYNGSSQAESLYSLSEDQSAISLDGETYYVNRKVSTETGILLVSLLPRSTLAGRAREALKPLLLMAVGILILLIAVIVVSLHLMTSPLAELSSQMSRMGEGDFSPLHAGSGCRESDMLAESYNDMVLRVNELIETNYIASLNEKNARLKALEAQINPHFLYNTLQAIATEALVAGSPEVYDMIVSLAGNLRYAIKGDQLVSLSSEMEYVRSYILLQKIRLRNRLVCSEHIQPDCSAVMIPKICIQLLVENAIEHGMRGDGSPLNLTISAAAGNGELTVCVRDDGRGITAEQLEALRSRLLDPAPLGGSQQSIGLANLASRLRILYQGQAGLLIDSEENRYTAVTMHIPLKEETNDPGTDHR